MAADDKARSAVLGYSNSANISSTNMPDGMRDLLALYGKELSATTTSSMKLSDIKLLADADSRANIGPLVPTQWGQDAPYNSAVIALDGNPSSTPTGCGVTSVAQVMNYHQYPDQAIGTSTATLVDGSTYTLDLTGHTYDWDAISAVIDNSSYTDEQANAVAQLMLDIGVAENAIYGDYVTGSYEDSFPKALIENFGYDKQMHTAWHEYYTAAEWDDLIYNELAEGRPMVYAGYAVNGGHAFVCDGYSDGYYHINWGWDGLCDGHFLLSALDPDEQGTGGASSGYFYQNSALIGVQPLVDGNGDYTGLACNKAVSLMCVSGSGKTGSYAFSGNYHNPYYASITVVSAVQIETADGNTTWQKDIDNTSRAVQSPDSISVWGSFSFADLADGTYTVRPAYFDTADQTYHLFPITYSTDSIAATIAISGDDLAYETITRGRKLTCNSLSCDAQGSGYYTGSEYTFTANVTNDGDSYVYTITNMLICDSETGAVISRTRQDRDFFLTLAAEPGETTDVGFLITMPTEAGTYTLCLIDWDENVYYSEEITVEQPDGGELALSVSDLRLTDESTRYSVDRGNVSVDMTLTCTSGTFIGNIDIFFFSYPYEGNGSNIYLTKSIIISAGASLSINFSGALSALEYGQSYFIIPYYNMPDGSYVKMNVDTYVFTVANPSGIVALQGATSTAQTDIKVYDVQGRMLLQQYATQADLSSLPAGVYIVKTPQNSMTVVKK